jgi:hypothetical protein
MEEVEDFGRRRDKMGGEGRATDAVTIHNCRLQQTRCNMAVQTAADALQYGGADCSRRAALWRCRLQQTHVYAADAASVLWRRVPDTLDDYR